MTANRPSMEEREQLAAELALGILEAEELASARALERSDAEFRQEVARWSGRLAPMLAEIEEAHPSERAWLQIERRIGVGSAANDNAESLRRRVNTWRGIAAGATAIAAALGVIVLTPTARPPVPAPTSNAPAPDMYVAMLGNDRQGMKLVASWNPARQHLAVTAAADMPHDARHAHELWVIPADGKPRSLGTMPSTKRMQMRLAPALARQFEEGATLAVSVEPQGGSPTGLPTGPVIISGKLERA